ncbi:MAG TPA: hypothetical protein VIL03_03900 [Clostridia bacterium]|jgi:hypothetical protein
MNEETKESKHLYLLLTKTTSVFSRTIAFIMGDKYTHSALALDKNLEKMYSFGRKKIFNPFLGGFTEERINYGVYLFSPWVPCVVIELDVTDEQYENVQKDLEQFINNSELYKYNYRAIYNHLFSSYKKSKNRFACSEFVYYILNKNNILDFKIPIAAVRPQTFLDNLSDKIIYKGNLHKYRSFLYMLNKSYSNND